MSARKKLEYVKINFYFLTDKTPYISLNENRDI